jgi:hypothetical protein
MRHIFADALRACPASVCPTCRKRKGNLLGGIGFFDTALPDGRCRFITSLLLQRAATGAGGKKGAKAGYSTKQAYHSPAKNALVFDSG